MLRRDVINLDSNLNILFEKIYYFFLNKELTAQQVSLLWTLQQKFVTSVIVGVKNVEELEEYMTCINNNLCLEDEDVLNNIFLLIFIQINF